MNQAARSVYYFGLYLVGLGVALIAMPNPVLTTFGISPTSEVWIRVVGMLALALSAYYIICGKQDITVFLKITVFVRSSIILFFTAFVLAGMVEPMLILFGVVDILGAAWTAWALKNENRW